jgi:hypothetical protein
MLFGVLEYVNLKHGTRLHMMMSEPLLHFWLYISNTTVFLAPWVFLRREPWMSDSRRILTDRNDRYRCRGSAVNWALRRERKPERSRRKCSAPWARPSPRAGPSALGEERLRQELDLWLSANHRDYGEDSVSGSDGKKLPALEDVTVLDRVDLFWI